MLVDQAREQINGSSVSSDNFAICVDEDLRIVDPIRVAFRYAANDRDRKLLRDVLEFGNCALRPVGRVLSNDRHRISGVGHFGKDDEVVADIFRAREEIANLAKVCVDITECALNLSNSNLHL